MVRASVSLVGPFDESKTCFALAGFAPPPFLWRFGSDHGILLAWTVPAHYGLQGGHPSQPRSRSDTHCKPDTVLKGLPLPKHAVAAEFGLWRRCSFMDLGS